MGGGGGGSELKYWHENVYNLLNSTWGAGAIRPGKLSSAGNSVRMVINTRREKEEKRESNKAHQEIIFLFTNGLSLPTW